MCMKTKGHKTQCPNKIRLLGLRFRHLRRIDTRFTENCCFWATACQVNLFFYGFLRAGHDPFAKSAPQGPKIISGTRGLEFLHSKQGNESVGTGVVPVIMARSREFVTLSPKGERAEEFGGRVVATVNGFLWGFPCRALPSAFTEIARRRQGWICVNGRTHSQETADCGYPPPARRARLEFALTGLRRSGLRLISKPRRAESPHLGIPGIDEESRME